MLFGLVASGVGALGVGGAELLEVFSCDRGVILSQIAKRKDTNMTKL